QEPVTSPPAAPMTLIFIVAFPYWLALVQTIRPWSYSRLRASNENEALNEAASSRDQKQSVALAAGLRADCSGSREIETRIAHHVVCAFGACDFAAGIASQPRHRISRGQDRRLSRWSAKCNARKFD